jgi:hypothetical protein
VLLYFLRRYIFIVCCDPSNMSKRILQSTGLVSVELIPHWLHRLSSSSHSLSCNIVNIIDVKILTGELPIDCVLRMLYSENSSVIRIGALLILISVCPISHLGPLSASTLTLLLQTPSCKTLWPRPHLCSTSIGSQAVALSDRSHFICHGPLLFMIFNVLIIFNFFM